MLISYFTSAWRVMLQQRVHTSLNVIGFSVGIAAAAMIALFAQYQLTVDAHQPHADRVYRVHQDSRPIGLSFDGAINAAIPLMLKNHAQVEDILVLTKSDFMPDIEDVVNVGDQSFKLRQFYTVTDNLLDFVAMETVSGDLKRAISQPGVVALSAREATRLFGHTQITGQRLNYQGGSYQVGAVFANLTDNTHFMFDVLTKQPEVSRGPFGAFSYFRLKDGADLHALEDFMTAENLKRRGDLAKGVTYHFISLKELYFHTHSEYDMKPGGSYLALQVSVILTFLLVLIAAVNFINFNIAGAAKRAKEVGVRKSLGASKWQLVVQFLTEALLVVSIAGVVALVMIEFLQPVFNQLVGSTLILSYSSWFMFAYVLTLLIVGIISGLYPALFIASFSAKRVLSGDLSRGKASIRVRKFTLCLQGAVAVGLIAAVGMLFQQMTLIKNTDMGYTKEQRLVIRELPAELLFQQNGNALLDDLGNIPGVAGVTLSDTDYATSMSRTMLYTWPNGETNRGMYAGIRTGYHAVDVLGLKLLAGRDFKPEYAADWFQTDSEGNSTVGILISAQMATMAGFATPDEAVGQVFTVPRRNIRATVVGVVGDLRLGSVNKPALPSSLILGYSPGEVANVVLKVTSNDSSTVMAQINQVLYQHLQRNDIELRWVYEEFLASHESEQKTILMLSLFSPLAIFLTLLGTFGLASFATLRRQKEMAIHKVLGASRLTIVHLLAKEFLTLQVLSCVISLPVTYWLVGSWLLRFNERVEQALWVYAGAGLSVALLTWITVASLAFKAASTRPSLILRYE